MSTLIKPSKKAPSVASTAPIRSGKPCSGRSVKKFSAFAKLLSTDPSKINIILAKALLGEEILDQYVGPTVIGSECVFSYPESDWYSVPVVDENGDLQYDESTENVIKMYFKINMLGANDAEIMQESMTNDIPLELLDTAGNEISNCVISGSTCKNPEGVVKPTKIAAEKPVSAKKMKESVAAASPVMISPTILAQLQPLNIGATDSTKTKPTTKMTRDFFEQMNSKTLIVNWMIEHMERADLVKCIQKGALSASDIKAAEDLAEMEVPGESGELSDSDIELAEITKQMPEKEVAGILKKLSKESIRDLINKNKNPDDRKKEIVKLCVRSGINKYSVKTIRGKLRIVDGNDAVDDSEINDVLDECATRESIKLRRKLAFLSAANVQRSRNEIPEPLLAESAEVIPGVTLENILSEFANLSIDDKKNAIVALCTRSGIDKYSVKTIRGKLRILDSGDAVDDSEIDDILQECANVELARLTRGSEFGKSKNSTKKAVKKYSTKKKLP
jgi:hypothetical protein